MDIIDIVLSKKYTDESLKGITGTLAGKNCTIKSATKADGVTTVVFAWTADDGTEKTTTIQVNDGTDDYEDLINRPKIEGVDLIGNKTFEDLGAASATDLAQTDRHLQDLADLVGDKANLPMPNETVVDNIEYVDTKADGLIDDLVENRNTIIKINKVVYNGVLYEDIVKSQRYIARTGKGTLNGNHYVSNASLNPMVCQIKGFLSNHKYKLVFKGLKSNYYTIRTIDTYNGIYVNTLIENQYVEKNTPFVIDIDGVEWGDYIYLDFSVGPYAPSELYVYVYDITNTPTYAIDSANFESCLSVLEIRALNLSYDNAKMIVNYNNWYKSKKLTTLGDSITEQNLWQAFLKQELLFASIVNKGIGGTRISGTNENAMWQNNRINALPLDTDVLTIMGGTNDSASFVDLGDLSITNHDTNTFVGAYNVLISKVLYKFYNLSSGKYSDIDYSGLTKSDTFKDIVIYIMTPPFNANTQYSGENSARLKAIADATKDVAKMWGIPCIDIYYNSGINTENVNALLQDGIHPNNLGAKKIASVVVNEMKSHAPIN